MKVFWAENKIHVGIALMSSVVIAFVLWDIFRPVPLPPPASVADVEEAKELGIDWLKNNFSDGLFLYEYDPKRAEIPRKSNALRQLMASRVVASEVGSDETLAPMYVENLNFVLDEWYQEDEKGAYVLFKDKSKLGANAMLLRTLVASPDFELYRTEARNLARGIIALQNPDGSFNPWYRSPDYEYDAEYLMYFYSGEAILALVEYYIRTGDEAILRAAEEAGGYYLVKYVDEIALNYHPAYVPWHTLSYMLLYEITNDRRYVQAIFTMNDRLMMLLDREIVPGRFYKDALRSEGQESPHSSSDAVYVEGLLYAYEIAQDEGDTEREAAYLDAIELGMARLVELQYDIARPHFEADPVTYVGAMPIREGNDSIRVDTIQHAIDAFTKYLDLVAAGKLKKI